MQIFPNYRGISLKDVVVKCFGVILLERFQSEKGQCTRPHHSGFRSGPVGRLTVFLDSTYMCTLAYFFKYIIYLIPCQALQGYLGV